MKQKDKKPLVIVTTGGSGGHIFPAESIAQALLEKGFEVVFITDKRGKVFQGLKGIDVYRLSAEHVMGRSFQYKVRAAFKLGFGVLQALRLLKKLRPVAVVGVGSYASIPAVVAAHLWQIPVVLHEQNAVLGRANRLLGRYAKAIATSFNPTYKMPQGVPEVLVGMPARPAILAREKAPYQPAQKVFHLLIFGGSQGASFFSQKVADALLKLPRKIQSKIDLVQQVRAEDMASLQKKYKKAAFHHLELKSFFDNMPDLLVKAHLVVGRSGASTLTELMVIGRPAILIPLPTSADNHQMENAKQFCDAGAGWLMAESDFNEAVFNERLTRLIENPDMLVQASQAANRIAQLDAGQKVADLVSDIVENKKWN